MLSNLLQTSKCNSSRFSHLSLFVVMTKYENQKLRNSGGQCCLSHTDVLKFMTLAE